MLSCERVLAELDGRPVGALEEASRSALAQVPHAAAWAVRFTKAAPSSALSARRFRQQAAPAIVRAAALGIAQACIPDPDRMLRSLLVQAIGAWVAWAHRDPNRDLGLDPAVWAAACRRAGGVPIADATRPDADGTGLTCQRFARNYATHNLAPPRDPTLDSASHLRGCVGT